MADNKNMQDNRDRSQVDGNSDYELSYIADKLGVSNDQIKAAIQAVGNNRDEIEKYITKNS